MSRIDHFALRVKDRWKTADFFIKALGYEPAFGEGIVDGGFVIDFDDGSQAKCVVLEPPEKQLSKQPFVRFFPFVPTPIEHPIFDENYKLEKCFDTETNIHSCEYHLPPEIFISDGSPDSIVGKWVEARNGIGGLHHIAYLVESVKDTMKIWKDNGYAEFSTDDVITCPGLTQIFTKPSELTGFIIELLERTEHGFCNKNVQKLMAATKDFK